MRDLRIPYLRVSLFIFLLVNSSLSAQDTSYAISGKVISAVNGEPIPNVNVFLNQTTIGTTSNAQGEFLLSGIPEGLHDLVLSFIGYQNLSIMINTDSLRNYYSFELQERVIELKELTVTFDRVWEGNYKVFKDYFLGRTENAENSRILNPEVIFFTFDEKNFVLTAETDEPIRIENMALGYELDYTLNTFIVDFKEKRNFLAGIPFFKEMPQIDSLQSQSWKLNREITYNGSFQHFIDSLLGDSLESAGFRIRREKRSKSRRMVENNPITKEAIFFELTKGTYVLQFNDFINVTYLDEQENQRYLNWRYGFTSKGAEPGPQSTSIYLEYGSVYIDESGYISNPLSVIMDGYWSYTKTADLMPLNYK